ncbi:MAG: transglutaminase family protein [Victivallales bacterium]
MAEAASKNKSYALSRMAVHLLGSIFFTMAASSAVWQYGNPTLSHLIVISSLAAGASIFIGTRFFNLTARKTVQIIILSLAMVWLIYRASSHITVEKYLIEFLCILGVSFGITLNMKDYGIQCMLGVILIICGSVFPRNAFIYCLPVLAVSGLILLYSSRLIPLAGDYLIKFSLKPLPQNWNYFIAHSILVLLLWIYFCTFFPSPSKTGAGFVTTSFMNENVNYMPPEYDKWFKAELMASSNTGTTVQNTMIKPSSTGKKGNQIVENTRSEDKVDGNGGGGGLPGDDLVFRVKSPVKMYWLGSLYDSYDGQKWLATLEMKKQKIKSSSLDYSGSSITQNFNVVKMYSPVLCSAYLPRYFEFPFNTAYSTESTFYNHRLLNPESVTVPFSYSVVSVDFTSETSARGLKLEHLWFENLKPQHYLSLPKELISKRLQALSSSITARGGTKYEKAILLRDYLRNNFKYRMDAKKIPEDREITDYFLFEMKEGNCQHYATTLAVLARLNGIPSRLALGFSPGNYNTLNGVFEVYEYHAHAWTQLFIEGKGWLTFDGTPPGQIISRTSPLVVGSFKDPFGDEWKITPPEITEHTKDFLNSKPDRTSTLPAGKYQDVPKPSMFQRIAVNIPINEEEFKSTIKKISGENPLDNTSNTKSGLQKLKDIFNDLKHNASVMTSIFLNGIKKVLFWLVGFQGLLLMLSGLGAFAAYRMYVKIRFFLRRRRRIRKCLAIIERFPGFSEKHPKDNINICYRITRELLDLSGLRRDHNMELFNYGASLERMDYNLSKDVLVIFFIYSKISYGTSEPGKEDVEEVFHKIIRIRNNLRNNLKLI